MMIMKMSENPLGALLEIRERRSAVGSQPLWRLLLTGAALLMLLLPTLGVTLQVALRGWGTPQDLLTTARDTGVVAYILALGLATFTVAIVIPWKRVVQDAGLLGSLRAGRGLVELLGTRTRPGEILDGIARQSSRSALREGAPFVIPLALGWLLLPYSKPDAILLLALAWAPATAVLVWASSYLAMAWELWVGSGDSSLTSQLLGLGLFMLLCPMGGCLFIGLMGGMGLAGADLSLGLCWLAGWLTVYAAANLLVSRNLALLGLERVPQLRERVEQAGRRLLHRNRNRWMRSWSDNPIVVRETCREALRTPGGPLGWLAFQVPALWMVPLTGGFLLAEGAPALVVLLFLSVMVLLVQVAMASSRTMLALVGEVECSTLEVLQQSGLSAREFCDGWATVGYRRRLLELAVLSPAAVGLALAGGISPLLPLLGLALTMVAVVFAAWAGLWASFARTRRQAQERLSGLMALTVVLSMLLVACTASTLWWPWVLVSCSLGLGLLSWGCRQVCLSGMSR